MAHHALRIQNDNGAAACPPIFGPKTIIYRHFALGVEISQQRKGDFKLLGKSNVGRNAVYADAQNLGI